MTKSLLFCAVVIGSIAPLAPSAAQSPYSVLSLFHRKTGTRPQGSLIEGAHGVLYGTTSMKAAGSGAVFSLTPPSGSGSWTIKALYAFQGGKDGASPECALAADPSGALYGTTEKGGAKKWGTVFKLTPPKNGHKDWTETILYSFTGQTDGGSPRAGLLLGSGGTLYGTASVGGSQSGTSGLGTVFALTPPQQGQTSWSQTVLHTFQGADGANPIAALVADPTGVLYGTTEIGGSQGWGAVFQMAPPAQGQTAWTETVLYSFTNGADGLFPVSGVTLDHTGNIFGTTGYDSATVYELSPPPGGKGSWSKSIIYTDPSHVEIPAGVTFGNNGALYGVTEGGGAKGEGYAYKLTPPAGGQKDWTESDIYGFGTTSYDPYAPMTSLLLTSSGVLVGTSELASFDSNGVAYQITP